MPNRFKPEKKAEKNAFAEYMAEVLRDAHYLPMIPPVDVIRQTWRFQAPYSRELRDLIVLKAQTFIRSMSNTNLIFLEDMAKWMSKYISVWAKQDPKYDSIREQDKDKAFEASRADLDKKLFYDFEYIHEIRRKTDKKRDYNAEMKSKYRKRREDAEALDEGFVCRVNANGETFVRYATNKSGTKQILDDDPTEVQRALEDFDQARMKHKRPRIHRSK